MEVSLQLSRDMLEARHVNDLKTVRVAALLALPRRNPRLSVFLSCSVDVHVSKAKPSEGKNLFGE